MSIRIRLTLWYTGLLAIWLFAFGVLLYTLLNSILMTVLDSRRTTRRQEQLLEAFGGVLVPEPAEPPPVDGERLGRCVQALKERERSIVVMTFYDEHTAAESGRALGL